jgi:hypothetical protein
MSENSLLERLLSRPIEYIAHSPIGEIEAFIEFAGDFERHPVIWNARIVALNQTTDQPFSQYIDISSCENNTNNTELNIEIGLAVNEITEPTILKTIMMIRQYKQLRSGRHEFLGANKNT